MKLNREQLKSLIKECLIEILTDGAGTSRQANRSGPITGVSEQRQPRRQRAFDPRLDTPIGTSRPSPLDPFREAVKREAGGNPIMEAIYADTARTTLPAMLSNGDAASSQVIQQEQFNGTPEEAFGEDSVGRWADLAFMNSPSKKTA